MHGGEHRAHFCCHEHAESLVVRECSRRGGVRMGEGEVAWCCVSGEPVLRVGSSRNGLAAKIPAGYCAVCPAWAHITDCVQTRQGRRWHPQIHRPISLHRCRSTRTARSTRATLWCPPCVPGRRARSRPEPEPSPPPPLPSCCFQTRAVDLTRTRPPLTAYCKNRPLPERLPKGGTCAPTRTDCIHPRTQQAPDAATTSAVATPRRHSTCPCAHVRERERQRAEPPSSVCGLQR
ncbi:hypothetical protein BC628DRAFT_1385201 [Trametes gibbosa]|nr:hypothetical protein BC628DRAFT_1385201 [Trametes gibbosa]